MKVKVIKWREGFQKITFTKLQAVMTDLSLKESKDNTDRILNGEQIIFQFEDDNKALQFYVEATDIGLYCEIIKE